MPGIARRTGADLRPLDPGLSAEVLDWVSELRVVWAAAGLSMNEFASVQPIDKGTISRYLNGQRVPRDRWFLDRLLAIHADKGRPVTSAVREHLTGLHLRALEVAHPHEYRVRLISDELEVALTGRLEAERYARALEQRLAERSRQARELADDKRRLRVAWDTDRVVMQAEYDQLAREIGKMTAQLSLARQREDLARERCQHLENILDRLDIPAAATDGHAAIRSPGDDPFYVVRRRPDALAALTQNELSILSLIAEGRSNQSIADHLRISRRYVEDCFSRIVHKLGLRTTDANDLPNGANKRVLATLEYLAATTQSAHPGSPSSSSHSVQKAREGGQATPSENPDDHSGQAAGITVPDPGNSLREARQKQTVEPATAQQTPSPHPSAAAGMKILVADDLPAAQETIQFALASDPATSHHVVVGVRSPEHLGQLPDVGRFELAFVDVNFRNTSHRSGLLALRVLEQASAPVLIYAAEDQDSQALFRLAAFEFFQPYGLITKGASIAEIRQAVKIIESRRPRLDSPLMPQHAQPDGPPYIDRLLPKSDDLPIWRSLSRFSDRLAICRAASVSPRTLDAFLSEHFDIAAEISETFHSEIPLTSAPIQEASSYVARLAPMHAFAKTHRRFFHDTELERLLQQRAGARKLSFGRDTPARG
jgi:DNA-binding NarL/FixJ family response regulator/transcriptional regulator with XRE-family HTH domain